MKVCRNYIVPLFSLIFNMPLIHSLTSSEYNRKYQNFTVPNVIYILKILILQKNTKSFNIQKEVNIFVSKEKNRNSYAVKKEYTFNFNYFLHEYPIISTANITVVV